MTFEVSDSLDFRNIFMVNFSDKFQGVFRFNYDNFILFIDEDKMDIIGEEEFITVCVLIFYLHEVSIGKVSFKQSGVLDSEEEVLVHCEVEDVLTETIVAYLGDFLFTFEEVEEAAGDVHEVNFGITGEDVLDGREEFQGVKDD